MALNEPPHFAPGAEFEYNNTNYVLLGLVAEKIEGQPLAGIFQDRLFGPFGMENTLLPVSASKTIPDRTHMATCWRASYALVDAPYPDDLQAAAQGGNAQPNDDTMAEPVRLLCGRGRHLHRGRPGDLDAGARRGELFDADFQRQWLASPEAPDPGTPAGQKYGYGIALITFGPNESISMAARCLATTPSWATTHKTRSR